MDSLLALDRRTPIMRWRELRVLSRAQRARQACLWRLFGTAVKSHECAPKPAAGSQAFDLRLCSAA